jgi:hypothetical protein
MRGDTEPTDGANEGGAANQAPKQEKQQLDQHKMEGEARVEMTTNEKIEKERTSSRRAVGLSCKSREILRMRVERKEEQRKNLKFFTSTR